MEIEQIANDKIIFLFQWRCYKVLTWLGSPLCPGAEWEALRIYFQLNWGSLCGDRVEGTFFQQQRQNRRTSQSITVHLSLHESLLIPFLTPAKSWQQLKFSRILPTEWRSSSEIKSQTYSITFTSHTLNTESWLHSVPCLFPTPSVSLFESVLQEQYIKYSVLEHFVIWKSRSLQRRFPGVTNTIKPAFHVCLHNRSEQARRFPGFQPFFAKSKRRRQDIKLLSVWWRFEELERVLIECECPKHFLVTVPLGERIWDLHFFFKHSLQFQDWFYSRGCLLVSWALIMCQLLFLVAGDIAID